MSNDTIPFYPPSVGIPCLQRIVNACHLLEDCVDADCLHAHVVATNRLAVVVGVHAGLQVIPA